MTRLQINDMVMSAYIKSLKQQGYGKQAENAKKIYEVQRAEIIANSEEVKDNDR